jgi:O-antigen ligase
MCSTALRVRASAYRLIPPLGVFVTVSAIGLADGGYFPTATCVSTLMMLGAVAASIGVCCWTGGRIEVTTLVALAALAAWTALSVLWSLDPAQSVLEAQRTLLYLAAVTALLLASPTGSTLALVRALAAACTLISMYALASGGHIPLADPIGYSDALGLLATIGLILALGLAFDGGWIILGAILPLGAVLYLAESRAAVVGLALGAVVAIALRGSRRTLVMGAPIATLAVVLTVSIGATSLPAREPLWTVAWRSAREHPLLGSGAGTYARTWLRERTSPGAVRDAHNLYLETLAELGPFGSVLLGTVLVVPLVAAVRARGRPLVPAAAGAYVAYLVHAAVHWDWEMPVVTLVGLGCACTLLLANRCERDARPLIGRFIVLAAVVPLAAGTYVNFAGSVALARSLEALRLGASSQAHALAQEATRWAPWSGEPWRVLGEISLSRGDRAAARTSFRRGLARDPHSWKLWEDLAESTHGAKSRAAARTAAALNPLGRTS